jgi:glutathione synthase/RimK-type ligase-like ATP-grasp enzyme
MRMFIYSHNEASEGAKELGKALGAKRIKHEGSAFVGGPNKIVINWGSRNVPDQVLKSKVINTPTALENNCNKLAFFRLASNAKEGPRVPRWTTDKSEVRKWIADKRTVVARKVLAGSSGEGIHFMSYGDKDGFVDAPLYTEYVKKKDEYRVHFVNGEVIDWQRKALRSGQNVDKVDWRIRNLDAGFVFVRNNPGGEQVTLPKDVIEQSQKAIRICGLDFGAIDLVYNEKEGQAYVLEVNTAPGLQGETVQSYATAFKKHWGK